MSWEVRQSQTRQSPDAKVYDQQVLVFDLLPVDITGKNVQMKHVASSVT